MQLKHILVIRVSAMGDVAMTVPVLKQLLEQYPHLHITVLTQGFLAPLFDPLERTTVRAIETKGRHKGLPGLFRLFRELKSEQQFHAVADLHNVLRSRIISLLFRTSGVKIATLDKGRSDKKKLTAKTNKQLVPLKTSFQRYADTFAALGLPVQLDAARAPFEKMPLPASAAGLFLPGKKYVCIAPFAKHREKMYPPEKMKVVIQQLLLQPGLQLFLLGGGKEEKTILDEWASSMPGLTNLAGRFSFTEELALLSRMDQVLSMDSANMHLASLFGVPVVSIWGATHPYAGFYGWGQPPANTVQTDLFCRPCSVFGNKPCYRGDHACMVGLPEQEIVKKMTGRP